MKFTSTFISDLFICEPTIRSDARGYFFESCNESIFQKNGLNCHFVQDNQSKSSYGVIRGLHYQLHPQAQTKLVRVLQGKILDVAVDIRKNSKTFGQFFTIELSSENQLQLLVPRGFAHGFSVLSDEAIVFYKCDNFYNFDLERQINPFSDFFGKKIDWKIPSSQAICSEKDKNSLFFEKVENNF